MNGLVVVGAVDLAYGEHDSVVADLLERIDSPTRPACPVGAGRTVVHPTTWGRRRVAAVVRATGASDGVPRAIAIARSHADATITRCAVVETCLLPDTGGHWAVHAVCRRAGEWTIESTLVDLPSDAPTAWASLIGSADIAVIDGADDGRIEAALTSLPSPAGGTVRADRALVARYGGVRRSLRADIDAALAPPPEPAPSGRRRLAVAAVVAGVLALGVAWAAVREHPALAAAVRAERVGGVVVDIPGDWRRSELDDRRVDGSGTRAVFADPDDGSRIVVVVTPLRAGSSRDSVAVSLRNRLAQRGDDVVREFSADASYAGRSVIAYRETPASGSSIAWYVHVAGDRQVSIGCQRGTGDVPIDDACAGAVRSLDPGPEPSSGG
ncbi:hypothetical protein nbrc107696_23090 [Gordonia spumicola]|uniref:Type VII secretion-associated protein n=1 Tax=Gordonia spumicola TaxID=589161 RepID=A0A7I9V9V4_9ACTN|nr:type VII secretion-associated protein [Gordonia spumicola]GEE01863.1 hypothetical protein nbrc107696_23090 [Gordonia spumicola]